MDIIQYNGHIIRSECKEMNPQVVTVTKLQVLAL